MAHFLRTKKSEGFHAHLFVLQKRDSSRRKSDKKNLVSGLEHFLNFVIGMNDDILRRDLELLRGLAARARAGVEFVLTEDHLDDWMLLAVEGGVGQDVASEKRRRSS